MDKTPHYITPDQLRVGMYIHLDLSWMDHPFSFSNFKIKDAEQLAQVRALGLKHIRYDPLRSDTPAPAEPVASSESAAPAVAAPAPIPDAEMEAKAKADAFHQRRLEAMHDAIHECEQQFSQAANAAKRIEREMIKNPPKTLQEASVLVDGMVESLLSEGDISLHAMQSKPGAAEQFAHSLNVTVLSLILAKAVDMSAEEVHTIGMGSLLHDIGKSTIPDRVTHNPDPLTRSELALLQQHAEFGDRLARDSGVDEQVTRIILQHHECCDGSGYPAHLKQNDIDPLARIVAVANAYDNLCNPLNPAEAMSPYEALAVMFAKMRPKFDPDLLKLLIKTLGVYPPGSIVELSDGRHGLVASVNPAKPMRPYVIIYAPEIPREKPLIINLGEESGLSIKHCLRHNQMPKEVLTYLSPGRRICYFFHHEADKPADPA